MKTRTIEERSNREDLSIEKCVEQEGVYGRKASKGIQWPSKRVVAEKLLAV